MLRKTGEARFHSDEQVADAITKALVQAARDDVPEELREAVFTQAVGLYVQKQVAVEQVAIGTPLDAGIGRLS